MPFGIKVGLNERTLIAASLGIALICMLLGISTRGLGSLAILAIFMSFMCAIFSVLVYQIGFLILPFVTKFLKVSEVRVGGFEIPPSQDVIIKNVGGVYYATVFIYSRFYQSAAVGVQEQEAPYMDLWERAVASLNFPFKFSLITYIEDLVKFREDVETNRAAAQLKLGREREKPRPDAITVDKWEREVAKQNEVLARLSAGEKPLGIIMYAMTTAIGVSAEAAMATAKSQANELKATFSNALNIEMLTLIGEDLKKCFEWEVIIPPSPKDLKASI